MAFGSQQRLETQISSSRLASLAGRETNVAAVADVQTSARQVSVQPDLSRIRTRSRDETPEQHQKRLASNRLNFVANMIVRFAIIGALVHFGYGVYEMTGTIHRGVAAGVILIGLDFLRVAAKSMNSA
ncbi:hypothetical protein [Hyphococcus lacteus]|uniref:Uncharacterized protein n=1 Tax=Hyphococcus lacteus TaxID=3143536 RepID=A0ABV3Z0F9_9PROT